MELRRHVYGLLKEIGAGKMMNTIYDTAWVARLSELGEPIGEQALEYLRSHQLADGSWGAREPKYYHDRVMCTLAAMTVLTRWGGKRDHARLQRAQLAMETMINGLGVDPAGATVGFEMIAPTLIDEIESLGIRFEDSHIRQQLYHYRAAKLAALPGNMINRFVTVAHSAEVAGSDGLQLLDVENL
ncbi:MAG: hypothetical protein JXA89_24895, partial [Anaerolineae bacterium]|nr:hypothetical protein [Anaerolineae bacterium]